MFIADVLLSLVLIGIVLFYVNLWARQKQTEYRLDRLERKEKQEKPKKRT